MCTQLWNQEWEVSVYERPCHMVCTFLWLGVWAFLQRHIGTLSTGGIELRAGISVLSVTSVLDCRPEHNNSAGLEAASVHYLSLIYLRYLWSKGITVKKKCRASLMAACPSISAIPTRAEHAWHLWSHSWHWEASILPISQEVLKYQTCSAKPMWSGFTLEIWFCWKFRSTVAPFLKSLLMTYIFKVHLGPTKRLLYLALASLCCVWMCCLSSVNRSRRQ